jgi:hypothetical protein
MLEEVIGRAAPRGDDPDVGAVTGKLPQPEADRESDSG